jgi:CDP-diacylglycerol--serine O-phosphatidyltransferase
MPSILRSKDKVMNAVEPVRRTYEIEDKTNLFLVHPLSNRLVPFLAHWRVSPNAVSMCGMACGLLAGLAYHHYTRTVYCLLGFVLMIGWHVMDGADGQLARLTRTQSATGKVLDGICDYVTFTSVYVGLALSLSRLYGPSVWWIVAASGACHAFQSASYELQRQDYDHWGCGRPSAAPAKAKSMPTGHISAIGHVTRMLDRFYIGLQHLSTGVDKTLRCQMETTVAHSTTRFAMMALYRDVFAKRVREWSVMSANYRTLGLFVFAVIGFPLYYFIWEIAVLSLLTVALLWGQRGLYRNFFIRAHALDQGAA